MSSTKRLVPLSSLRLDGERDLRKVPVYARLREVLIRDDYRFRLGLAGGDWNRALLLNLGFWSPGEGGDVLVDDRLPADVVAHVAWHHLATRALGREGATPAGLLLGESIASAFDLYLVGRLLHDAPRAAFLRTQVPAMAEVAESAGLPPRRFEALLASIAEGPEAAFSDLRGLLFTVGTKLVRARGAEAAAKVLEGVSRHRFAPLLHHYNLGNWVLYARAHGKAGKAPRCVTIDRALRGPGALDWLEAHWLDGAVAATKRGFRAPRAPGG